MSILTYLTHSAIRFPGSRIVLLRRFRADLTKSILPTLEEEVFPLFGWAVPPGGAMARQSRTEYRIGASRIVPIGIDTDGAASLLSTAWTKAYAAEATEIPYDTLVKLDGAMRWTAAPGRMHLPQEAEVIADCNPVNPQHPLNLRAEECPDAIRLTSTREAYYRTQEYNRRVAVDPVKRWKRIITTIKDNPGYWDFRAWDYTPAGRSYVEKRLEGLQGHLRERWLYGLWRSAEGVVFPEFRDTVHVVDDFEPPADWPWYVGWDPGFAHPTGIPWVCVSPLGDLFVGDEVYEGGKSIAQHAETCLKKCAGRTVVRWFGDPHEFFSRRAQGESCAAQAKKAGLPTFMPWAAQEKQAMVNAYRQLLQNSVTLAQTGRRVGVCLYVMKRCVNTIMEHQSWAFKRNAKGELQSGDDIFEDNSNHLVGDPLVGMVATGMLKYGIREKAVAAENSFD